MESSGARARNTSGKSTSTPSATGKQCGLNQQVESSGRAVLWSRAGASFEREESFLSIFRRAWARTALMACSDSCSCARGRETPLCRLDPRPFHSEKGLSPVARRHFLRSGFDDELSTTFVHLPVGHIYLQGGFEASSASAELTLSLDCFIGRMDDPIMEFCAGGGIRCELPFYRSTSSNHQVGE